MIHSYKLPPHSLTLDEGGSATEKTVAAPKAIQLMKVGTFWHGDHGRIPITVEMLEQIKKNFDARVRDIDIAIDYSHNNMDRAAAWIKALEIRADGQELWTSDMEWTPSGASAVVNKEFRYFSPEFSTDYEDKILGKKYGAVLLGGGLLNRPCIKGMAPTVQLQENNEGEKMLTKTEEKTAPKKLADMSPEELQAKIDEMQAMLDELQAKVDGLTAENSQLKEKNEQEKKLGEKKAKFDKLLTEGKVVEAQRKPYMDGDQDKFIEMAGSEKSLNMGESKGSSKTKDDDDSSSTEEKTSSNTPNTDKVISLAEKLVADRKCRHIGEATSIVLKQNPDLKKKYIEENSVR